MPTTVRQLVESVGLQIDQTYKWGEAVSSGFKGVYIIAIAATKDHLSVMARPSINLRALRGWINRAQGLAVDGEPASVETIEIRLKQYWLPEETILYIGQTGRTITQRLNQFYGHQLGAPAPHSGGQWIKTLNNLEELTIYIVPTQEPAETENTMLEQFVSNVTLDSKASHREPNKAYPFANIAGPLGRKDTGINHTGTLLAVENIESPENSFLNYLDQRLAKKNHDLSSASDRVRSLLKTERAELEVIRNKFLELFEFRDKP